VVFRFRFFSSSRMLVLLEEVEICELRGASEGRANYGKIELQG
jgi:hypothetical protein